MELTNNSKWTIVLSGLIFILIVFSIIITKQLSAINSANLAHIESTSNTEHLAQINQLREEINSLKIILASNVGGVGDGVVETNAPASVAVMLNQNHNNLISVIEKTIENKFKDFGSQSLANNKNHNSQDFSATKSIAGTEQKNVNYTEQDSLIVEDEMNNVIETPSIRASGQWKIICS